MQLVHNAITVSYMLNILVRILLCWFVLESCLDSAKRQRKILWLKVFSIEILDCVFCTLPFYRRCIIQFYAHHIRFSVKKKEKKNGERSIMVARPDRNSSSYAVHCTVHCTLYSVQCTVMYTHFFGLLDSKIKGQCQICALKNSFL